MSDTPGRDPGVYAAKALHAYTEMQRRFRTRSGLYRRDGLHSPGTAAHLWPFIRAVVATLDLAGIEGQALGGFDAGSAIADRLDALERYWDPGADWPAYSSDVIGTRLGGDRYYDDNAWVGLALAQLERLRPGSGRLDRARALLDFALAGWDDRDRPGAGGVFWVEQGRGVGVSNHDRNTVSTAPNAQLALHLSELSGEPVPGPGSVGPEQMYDWVLATLDSSRDGEQPGTGLFWDKVRGDGTIDRRAWSYNQGSMVGASVLLARRAGGGGAAYLARAEAIARKALADYGADGYEREPAAFNAILFRNLLALHAATGDRELRAAIREAMERYADWAWNQWGDRRGRLRGAPTLLDQSALVQVLALLAWNPGDYRKLA